MDFHHEKLDLSSTEKKHGNAGGSTLWKSNMAIARLDSWKVHPLNWAYLFGMWNVTRPHTHHKNFVPAWVGDFIWFWLTPQISHSPVSPFCSRLSPLVHLVPGRSGLVLPPCLPSLSPCLHCVMFMLAGGKPRV